MVDNILTDMSSYDKINGTLILGVIGGILVIASAFFQWREKNIEQDKADKIQAKAEVTAQKLEDLQVKHLAKTEKLEIAYEKIATLQTEIKNQVTGGDSHPILAVTSTPLLLHKESGKSYHIVFFDLVNSGKYPLQNVRITITDFYGNIMPENGIMHSREALGASTMTGVKAKEWARTYDVYFKSAIGTVTPNRPYVIYTTTYHPENTKKDVNYNVELQWNNGNFVYYITLTSTQEKLVLKSLELVENGAVVRDNLKYIRINDPKVLK